MKCIYPALLCMLFVPQSHAYCQGPSDQLYNQTRVAVISAAKIPEETRVNANHLVTPALETQEQTAPTFPSLKPRPENRISPQDRSNQANRSSKIATPTITVASSLAVVLGLFAALVWASRKFGNGSMHSGNIPKEVVQSLGSLPLDPRTRVTMLRCGNRILVLSQTAGNARTLCEITDPEEVQDLTAACLGNAKHAFASTLHSIENEKTNRTYIGGDAGETVTPNRRRLFASV